MITSSSTLGSTGSLREYHIFSGRRSLKAGQVYFGWASGDTKTQVSVSNFDWKRLGQFSASKVSLLQRSTGLICKQETEFTVAAIC